MFDSRTHLRPSNYAVKLLGSKPLSTLLWGFSSISVWPVTQNLSGWISIDCLCNLNHRDMYSTSSSIRKCPFHLSAGWCPQESPQRSSSLSTWSFYASYPSFCHHFSLRNPCPGLVCFTPRGDLPFTSLPTTGHACWTLQFYPSFQNDDREAQHRGKKVKGRVAQLYSNCLGPHGL